MSYPIGSILGRIDPLPDVTEDVPGQYDDGGAQVTVTKKNPLNKLRIVAASPLNKASVESWQGAGDSEFVVVTPADDFGSNENAPVSALNNEYEVLEYGEEEDTDKRIELESPAHKRALQRSPEQVFAAETAIERKRAKAAGEEEKPRLFGAALAAKQKKEKEAAEATS